MNYYGGMQPQYGGSYQPSQSMYGNQRMDFLQQTQQAVQQPQQGVTLGGAHARIVSCREEGVASQVMPNGEPWVFIDNAHGMLYYKRLDPNGTAVFLDFVLSRQETPAQPQYVTMDMFDALRKEIDVLKTQKGGAVNDE